MCLCASVELSGLSQCQSQVLEQLLHLLRAQLEHNSDTARQLDSFGFGVIVHLLSSMSAAHMTVPVVDALSALALSRPSAAARHLMRLDLYLPASDSVHQRWLTALQTHRWPPQILVDLIVDATHPLPTGPSSPSPVAAAPVASSNTLVAVAEQTCCTSCWGCSAPMEWRC